MTASRSVRARMAAVAITALTLAGAAALLSACNTVAGAGQDISATGRAVTGGAEKTQQALPPTPK